jgi:hypothetical protein
MTVQALRLSMSKEFPDYNFDDILGSLNAGNSLDLPIPSQELPNLCCFDDNLLDFDRNGDWASPGKDCSFRWGGTVACTCFSRFDSFGRVGWAAVWAAAHPLERV